MCAQARSIEPAVVWGRLYHLHAGFPALEVTEGLLLARGTADPLADACRQQEVGTPRFDRPTGDWDLIHGELVTFTDPQRDLPPIDRLEAGTLQLQCGFTGWLRLQMGSELTGSGGASEC
nr:gamma-glutamylcyclotransferase [Desulfolutivibrio sulfodismutans]